MRFSANLKSKSGPLLLFIFLVILSQQVLPRTGHFNWGPFFDWRLFAGLYHGAYQDLELQKDERRFFLTDAESISRDIKWPLWGLTQEYNSEVPKTVEKIKGLLQDDATELVRVCKVQVPLEKYMLLSTEEKKAACAD